MSELIIYGPQFSYFVRAISLLCHYKSLRYRLSMSPYGEAIKPFGEAHACLHPFKKLPVLIDGDLVLPETMAMVDYLTTKPGPNFLPESVTERARCLAFANMLSLYVHRTLVVNVLLEFAFPKGEGQTVRFEVVEQHLPEAREILDWLNATMASPHFFYGDSFTVCDAYLIPMLDYLEQLPEPHQLVWDRPQLLEYLQFHRQQTYTQGVLGPRGDV